MKREMPKCCHAIYLFQCPVIIRIKSPSDKASPQQSEPPRQHQYRTSDFYSGATLRLSFIFLEVFCETSISQCKWHCTRQNTVLEVSKIASIKLSDNSFSHNFILHEKSVYTFEVSYL